MSVARTYAAVGACLWLGSAALGAGGGQNVLLVVNSADENALRVANAYVQERGIPFSNVVMIDAPKVHGPYFRTSIGTSDFNTYYRDPIVNAINSRGLDNQIDYIVNIGGPFSVSTPSNGAMSFSAALSLVTPLANGTLSSLDDAYATAKVSPLYQGTTHDLNQSLNTFEYQTGTNNAIHQSQVYTVNSKSVQYYMAGALTWTGQFGMTADQMVANIQRTVAGDGEKPDGAVYIEDNSDVRSNSRRTQWKPVIDHLESIGVDTVHEGFTPGYTPLNRSDVRGAIVGYAAAVIPNGSTYLPGSFADNLTSWGMNFHEATQTKATAWLAAGAAGSAGTITEPSSDYKKFPDAAVHVFIAEGSTLGEAYAKSLINSTLQSFVGDPLSQAYADLPSISLNSAPSDGATVSGTINLNTSASLSANATLATGIKQMELWVDGKLMETVASDTGNFSLDTTNLSDGQHEIRIVAVNNAAAESQNKVRRVINVNNLGRSVSAPTNLNAQDKQTLPVNVNTTTNGATVSRVELRYLGKTLGSVTGGSGNINLDASKLAYGDNRVVPVAIFSDNSEVVGAPITVNRAPTYLNGTAGAPEDNRVTGVKAEFFLNKGASTIAGSDYSGTPDITTRYNALSVINTSKTQSNYIHPVHSLPFTTSDEVNKLAARYTAKFFIPEGQEGEYKFNFYRSNDSQLLLIDGQTLINFNNHHDSVSSYADVAQAIWLGEGEHELELFTSNLVTTDNNGKDDVRYDTMLYYRGPDGVTRMADGGFLYQDIAPVAGGSASWSVNTSGHWSEASNWGGNYPHGVSAIATFDTPLSAAQTITLDAHRTVGGLVFNDTSANRSGSNSYKLDLYYRNLTLGDGVNPVTLNFAGNQNHVIHSSALDKSTGKLNIVSPTTITVGKDRNAVLGDDSGGEYGNSGILSGTGSLTFGGGITYVKGGSDGFSGDVFINSGTSAQAVLSGSTKALGTGTITISGTGRLDRRTSNWQAEVGAKTSLPAISNNYIFNQVGDKAGYLADYGSAYEYHTGVWKTQKNGVDTTAVSPLTQSIYLSAGYGRILSLNTDGSGIHATGSTATDGTINVGTGQIWLGSQNALGVNNNATTISGDNSTGSWYVMQTGVLANNSGTQSNPFLVDGYHVHYNGSNRLPSLTGATFNVRDGYVKYTGNNPNGIAIAAKGLTDTTNSHILNIVSDGNTTVEYSGKITGDSTGTRIVKLGSGTVKMSNPTGNDYKGSTTVRSGTVLLGATQSLGNSVTEVNLGDITTKIAPQSPTANVVVLPLSDLNQGAKFTASPLGSLEGASLDIKYVDGYHLRLGDWVIVTGTNGEKNGVYRVTSEHTSANAWDRVPEFFSTDWILNIDGYGRQVTATVGRYAGTSFFYNALNFGDGSNVTLLSNKTGGRATISITQDVADPDVAILTDGAMTITRNFNVVANNSTGKSILGGNTASNSAFTGKVTLNRDLTVSQVAGGTATFSGDFADGTVRTSLTNGGSGYSAVPNIHISGGDGTGVTATATLGLTQNSIEVTNGGSYASSAAPLVTISGGGGAGATGRAIMWYDNLSKTYYVHHVILDSPGIGYTSAPTISFSTGGATAVGNAENFTVSQITVTNPGVGYTVAPTFTIDGNATLGTPTVYTGGVTKEGLGTVIFSTPKSYHGNTLIKEGTLALTGTGSFANSPVIDVAQGATLDVSGVTFALGTNQSLTGKGMVVGTIFNNGTVSPGNSIGTLNVDEMVIGSTGQLDIELETGGVSDLLAVANTLTLEEGATLNLSSLSGEDLQGTYTIATYDQLIGTFATITGMPDAEVDYGAHSITITVPEPTSLGFLGIAGVFAFSRRRRAMESR